MAATAKGTTVTTQGNHAARPLPARADARTRTEDDGTVAARVALGR